MYSATLLPGCGSGRSNWRMQLPWRDTRESWISCGRKDSVKQIISGLSAAVWIETSVGSEQSPWMIEVHSSRQGKWSCRSGAVMWKGKEF